MLTMGANVMPTPRWQCGCCGSTSVVMALPALYRQERNGELTFIQIDEDATCLWWLCDSCEHTSMGEPSIDRLHPDDATLIED